MDLSTAELWGPLFTTVAKLSLVLALLLLVLYLMKRFLNSQGQITERGFIKVMASMHIAPKQRIILLDVLGDKILIGISPQQITHLTKVNGEYPEPKTIASGAPLFERILKRTNPASQINKAPESSQTAADSDASDKV